ncbi:MAG: hypothetical protein R3B74_06760 [Nitrospirales bacterium]|nr:hypothetical protein [Nitrospirales bacterium]
MRDRVAQSIYGPSNTQAGGALLAALILVALSGIMGATILFATSTDIHISGNYRRAVQSLYAAEAGLAETRRRLVGFPGTHPWYAGDSLSTYQANWSAYVLTDASWQLQQDPAYSTGLTNYVPTNGDFINTLIVSNSLQTVLPYWAKVQHKSEYDAEQAGHSASMPHYVDGDGTFTTHSKNNRGHLIRFGYSGNTSVQPGQFSTSAPSLYPPVEVIRSQGEVEGAISIVQADVAHQPGPPIWAPVYVGSHIHLSGGAITIQGHDACGLLPAGLPPIFLGPSATVVGTASLNGNPGVPQVGSQVLNLSGYFNQLQASGQSIPGDLTGVTLGTVASPEVQVAKPSGGMLILTNVTGYGLLLVDGSLRIYPPFHWEGMIIVSGQATIESGLSPVLIQGVVWANELSVLNNDVTITMDSCPISRILRIFPTKVLNWRQLL